MINKIKDLIQTIKEMDLKTIEAYKYSLIFLLTLDLFGIYYYLGLKKLGISLMLVCIGFLSLFLILERNKKEEENMNILDNEQPSEPEDKKKKDDEEDDGFHFSMPTEESIKRALTG